MSRERSRIDTVTADRLLGGDEVSHDHDRLTTVLSAAAGQGRPTELAGRAAALAGFRAARLHPAPPARKSALVRTALVRLLTVKAAVVAALSAGAVGIALAASTGTIPSPLPNQNSGTVSSPAVPGQHPSSTHGPTAPPSPSLIGLCRAYTAKAANGGPDRGKSLDSPAFQELITAAGGRDLVDSFCATLLADSTQSNHSGGVSTDRTTQPKSHPSGPPTDRGNSHAGG